MNISGITLFIFGGVAELEGEVPHPKAEFRIALAGPLSSLFLSFLFFLLTAKSGIGQKIGLFFIFFGIFSLFGRMPGGLWLMLIGWFLYTAAQASHQQATVQQSLAGVKVKDIITRDLVTLPSNLSLETAVNDYFLKHGFGGFPVMDNGRFLGFITLKEIKNVRREDWGIVTVSEVAVSHGEKWEVSLEDDAMKSLELMIKEDKGRIAVLDRGTFVGMITRNGIARYLQIKKEMAGA